jgi:membrane-associated phospholipid phosphatase
LPAIAGCLGVLFIGSAAIWNLNYLAGLLSLNRLHDEGWLGIDCAIYQWLAGVPVFPEGMYPLVKNQWLFNFVESNYYMFYPEIFLLTFVIIEKYPDRTYFLTVLLLCYIVGLSIFIVYPVFGPYIYPETMHPDYHSSIIRGLTQGIVAEYDALQRGSSITGMAYFVGLPSLHVALALLFQVFLWEAPCHFWAFLPVNVIMSLATIYLGTHYLIDIPAGILMTLIILFPGWRRRVYATREPRVFILS